MITIALLLLLKGFIVSKEIVGGIYKWKLKIYLLKLRRL